MLIALILNFLTGCISDNPFKEAGLSVPADLGDGWETATPEEVGISRPVLARIYSRFISEDRFFNARSLLIVKDGQLVFEVYCRATQDRGTYNNIQSITKSNTSLVFGIIKSEGYIDSLGQTLYSIIPDKFPSDNSKRSITIRHLLTMTSGLAFDNDDFSVEIYADEPGDPAKYILNKPMYASPGERFYYRDCDPHLLSYAIERITKKTLDQWAKERLFAPLGIDSYFWDVDHTGTPMGAHGLYLKPRDLAKIGQVVLTQGQWNSSQIVDSTWIAVSTRSQIPTEYTTEPEVRDYGYYWWTLPRWQAIEAWGRGGNFILIVPSREMVVVMTSTPYTDDDVVGTRPEKFHELITPLIEE